MEKSFFVNRSVLFLPRENETRAAIKEVFSELWQDLMFGPAWQHLGLFFVLVLVVVVATDDNEHFVSWKKYKVNIKKRNI